MRNTITLPHAVFPIMFIVLAIAMLVNAQTMLGDPDTGWHIVTGDWIRTHHQLPIMDVFSYTANEYQWFNMSWLWDVGVSGLHQAGGLWYPIVATTIIAALTLTLLMRYCMMQGAGLIASFACVMLASFSYIITLTVRPHQISYLFAVWVMLMLARWRNGQKSDVCFVIGLVAILGLWGNLHGGFFIAFTLLGACGLELMLQRNWHRFRVLFLTGMLSLAALIINPYGIHIFEAAWRTLGGPLAATINEWKPAAFEAKSWVYLTYPLLFLIALVPMWRITTPTERILSIFWLLMGLTSVRNMPVFVLVSLPSFTRYITLLIEEKQGRFTVLLARKDKEYYADLAKPMARRIVAVFAIILIALLGSSNAERLVFQGKATFLQEDYPVAEVAFVARQYPCLNMFNEYAYGGYIIYALQGKLPVFMDGRAETAYPPGVVKDFMDFNALKNGLPEILKRYRVELAMVNAEPQHHATYFAALADWQEVFSAHTARVFVKRSAMQKKCE